MNELKKILERKLCNAITVLYISAGKNSMAEIRLDLGVIVGLNIALREICIANGEEPRNYRNSHFMRELDGYSFRKLKLKEVNDFAFPKTVYEDLKVD